MRFNRISNFFKLTRRKKLRIQNSFTIDSKVLINIIETAFKERGYRTEIFSNGLNFSTPIGFTTHSGDNFFAAMKICRKGSIYLIKLPNNEIEIVSQANLKHLIINTMVVGISFFIIAFFYLGNDSKIEFFFVGLASMGAILIIGVDIIKNQINTILNESLNIN